MKKTWNLLLLLQLIVISPLNAQSPVYDWGKRLQSNSSGGAICTSIAAEYSLGSINSPAAITNIYVTGKFIGNITIPELNNLVLTSQGGHDIFVLKINASGSVIYATTIGSPATDDEGNDICVQRNFSGTVTAVYVTGKSNGKFLLAKLNADLTAPANNRVFTTVYPSGYATGRGIVINGSTLYVTGSITGTGQIDFYDYLNNTISVYTNITPANTKELMVCSFNTSLMPLAGIVPYASTGDNEAFDIAFGNNRLFITGYFMNTVQFSSNGASSLGPSSGTRDIFLANLNPNLSGLGFDKTDQKRAGGNQQNDLNGYTIQDIGYSVAYATNAVYLAGGVSPNVTANVDNSAAFTGSGFMAKFPYTPATATLGNVTYVCKITSNVNGDATRPYGLTTDPDANILVTGIGSPGGKVYDAGGITNILIPGSTAVPDPCGFICKFNSAGSLLWNERINQQVFDQVYSVSTKCGQAVLASKCDIYHVGELSTTNSTTFGTNPPFHIPNQFYGCNAFVAKASNTMTMDNDTTVCFNTPTAYLILSANGASNYNWTVSPSTGVTITTPASASPTVTITSPGTYTFTCTTSINYGSSAACQQTGSCIVTAMYCPTVQSGKASAGLVSPDVIVWPNPGSDIFTVNWKGVDHYEIEVYDMIGRLAGRQKSAGETTPVNLAAAELPYGIYILKLTAPGGLSHIERIVYQRP
ncbi:MAG: hypothetical protein FD123_466 [Bacteroidetes bacterium]|nr:MAG: hypothetical protein FD123_466 [Bacteroidota bacterium]